MPFRTPARNWAVFSVLQVPEGHFQTKIGISSRNHRLAIIRFRGLRNYSPSLLEATGVAYTTNVHLIFEREYPHGISP